MMLLCMSYQCKMSIKKDLSTFSDNKMSIKNLLSSLFSQFVQSVHCQKNSKKSQLLSQIQVNLSQDQALGETDRSQVEIVHFPSECCREDLHQNQQNRLHRRHCQTGFLIQHHWHWTGYQSLRIHRNCCSNYCCRFQNSFYFDLKMATAHTRFHFQFESKISRETQVKPCAFHLGNLKL